MPKKQKHGLKVGDKVAYSVQWLRNTGQSHSDLSHARGTLTKLTPFGSGELATVDWGNPDIPERILAANLAKVGLNTKFSNC